MSDLIPSDFETANQEVVNAIDADSATRARFSYKSTYDGASVADMDKIATNPADRSGWNMDVVKSEAVSSPEFTRYREILSSVDASSLIKKHDEQRKRDIELYKIDRGSVIQNFIARRNLAEYSTLNNPGKAGATSDVYTDVVNEINAVNASLEQKRQAYASHGGYSQEKEVWYLEELAKIIQDYAFNGTGGAEVMKNRPEVLPSLIKSGSQPAIRDAMNYLYTPTLSAANRDQLFSALTDQYLFTSSAGGNINSVELLDEFGKSIEDQFKGNTNILNAYRANSSTYATIAFMEAIQQMAPIVSQNTGQAYDKKAVINKMISVVTSGSVFTNAMSSMMARAQDQNQAEAGRKNLINGLASNATPEKLVEFMNQAVYDAKFSGGNTYGPGGTNAVGNEDITKRLFGDEPNSADLAKLFTKIIGVSPNDITLEIAGSDGRAGVGFSQGRVGTPRIVFNAGVLYFAIDSLGPETKAETDKDALSQKTLMIPVYMQNDKNFSAFIYDRGSTGISSIQADVKNGDKEYSTTNAIKNDGSMQNSHATGIVVSRVSGGKVVFDLSDIPLNRLATK